MRGFSLGLGFSRRGGGGAASPAYQQILDLATADGWTAVYDVTNPNTRTTRESGGSTFISAVADGLGNLPDLVQATEANQPQLSVGEFSDLDGLLADDGSRWLLGSLLSNIPQPYSLVFLGQATTLGGGSNDRPFVGFGDSGAAEKSYAGHLRNSSYIIFAGGLVSDGTADVNKHVFSSLFDGASSSLRIDASQVASGDAGANPMRKIGLMVNPDALTQRLFGRLGAVLVREDRDATKISSMEDLMHNLSGIAKA